MSGAVAGSVKQGEEACVVRVVERCVECRVGSCHACRRAAQAPRQAYLGGGIGGGAGPAEGEGGAVAAKVRRWRHAWACSLRPARRVHKRAGSNTPTLRCVIGVQRAGAAEHQCLGVLHTSAAQSTA